MMNWNFKSNTVWLKILIILSEGKIEFIFMQIGGSIQSSFRNGIDLNIALSWILNSICNFGISLDGKTIKISTEKNIKDFHHYSLIEVRNYWFTLESSNQLKPFFYLYTIQHFVTKFFTGFVWS